VGDALRAAGARLGIVEVGTAGAVAARLAPAVGDSLAAGLVLPDLEAARRRRVVAEAATGRAMALVLDHLRRALPGG
jgi:hypothetical protein